jgi:hypothetical protein
MILCHGIIPAGKHQGFSPTWHTAVPPQGTALPTIVDELNDVAPLLRVTAACMLARPSCFPHTASSMTSSAARAPSSAPSCRSLAAFILKHPKTTISKPEIDFAGMGLLATIESDIAPNSLDIGGVTHIILVHMNAITDDS